MTFCSENFPADPPIPNATELLRRIPPWHVHFDANENRLRPSWAAFEDDGDDDPMSAYLSSVLAAESREPSTVLAGHEGYALASITAALAREHLQTVHRDPLPEESSHAVVCGDKEAGKNNAPTSTVALAGIWVIAPPAPA